MCRDVESNDLCNVCALHTHFINQHGEYISTEAVKPRYTHMHMFTQHEMCFSGKLNIDFTSLCAIFSGNARYESKLSLQRYSLKKTAQHWNGMIESVKINGTH